MFYSFPQNPVFASNGNLVPQTNNINSNQNQTFYTFGSDQEKSFDFNSNSNPLIWKTETFTRNQSPEQSRRMIKVDRQQPVILNIPELFNGVEWDENLQFTHRKDPNKRDKKLNSLKTTKEKSEPEVVAKIEIPKIESSCGHRFFSPFLAAERHTNTQVKLDPDVRLIYLQLKDKKGSNSKCGCTTPDISIHFKATLIKRGIKTNVYAGVLVGKLYKRDNTRTPFNIDFELVSSESSSPPSSSLTSRDNFFQQTLFPGFTHSSFDLEGISNDPTSPISNITLPGNSSVHSFLANQPSDFNPNNYSVKDNSPETFDFPNFSPTPYFSNTSSIPYEPPFSMYSVNNIHPFSNNSYISTIHPSFTFSYFPNNDNYNSFNYTLPPTASTGEPLSFPDPPSEDHSSEDNSASTPKHSIKLDKLFNKPNPLQIEKVHDRFKLNEKRGKRLTFSDEPRDQETKRMRLNKSREEEKVLPPFDLTSTLNAELNTETLDLIIENLLNNGSQYQNLIPDTTNISPLDFDPDI